MKPRSNSFLRNTAIAASIVLCLGQSIDAGILTWDGSDTVTSGAEGGAGTWNVNSTANWWNGTTDLVWPALGGTDDDAVFGGTAGTVTLGSAITANDLTFNTTGYTLSGAQTLTLNGTTPTITTASGVTATIGNNTATIIDGTAGLTKVGAGTLTLNGSAVNTFTGGVTIRGGTLRLDYSNYNGNQLINSGNALTLGGGTLAIQGNNTAAAANVQTFASTTLNTGSNTISIAKGASGASATLNLGQLTVNPGAVVFFTPTTTWSTTASTTEIVKVTSGGSITVPGSGAVSANAGLMTGTGAATRWVQVNSTGQLLGAVSSTALGATSNSTSIVNSISGSDITFTTTTANSYGLLLNTNTAIRTVTLAAGGTYTLNGIIGIGTTGSVIAAGSGTSNIAIGSEKNFVINMATSSGLTISAPIANNGSTSGTGGTASSITINSTSTGATTLSGANTYSGGLFLNSGILNINSTTALGAAAGTFTINGGTIDNTTAAAITNANNNPLTINSDFSFTGTKDLNLGTGAVSLGTNPGTTRTITTTAGTLTLGGNIGNGTTATGLTKSGAGVLVLSGNNSYTGSTTINAGGTTSALLVTANNALGTSAGSTTIASGAALGLSGGINYSTAETIVGSGPGNTAASGVFTVGSRGLVQSVSGNNTFAGAIQINATGLTRFGTQDGAQLTLSGPITMSGVTGVQVLFRAGGTNGDFVTLSNSGNSWDTDTQIFSSNIGTGAGLRLGINNALPVAVSVAGTGSTGTGTMLDLASFNQELNGLISSPNTLKIGNSVNGTTSILTLNNTSNLASGTGTVIQDGGAGGTTGKVQVVKTGAFNQTLQTANTYTGGTLIKNGSITLQSGNDRLATAGTVTLGDTGTTGKLVIGETATARNQTLAGLTTTGLGGSVVGATTSTDSVLTLNITSGTNTFGGTLGGSGTNENRLALTKSGSGTLSLSGSSTYSGATTISTGTLQAGSTTALSSNSAVSIANVSGAALDLNGYSNTVASLAGGGALGGNVSLGAGTLTTGGNNSSTDYAGNISGVGGLIKNGTGIFTLSGTANSYAGSTTVNGGGLLVNGTLASSGVTVANTATLGGTGTLANSVVINSGGTLSAATSTTAGTLTMGSLTLDSGSNLAYEFGTSSDLISVSNSNGLTINGGALSLYATGGVSPLVTNGTYSLFNYSGTLGGAISNLSIANSQAGKAYSLNDTGSVIELILGTATSSDWTDGASNGLWTDSGNWSGSVPNSFGAVANFNIAGTSITVDGAKTVGSIIFDNATGITVNGGGGDTITLDNGIAAGAISTVTGSHTINTDIVLNGPANIAPAAGTTLTLGGDISGSKGLTFSGAGTSVLSGTNSYTTTNITSGSKLQIGDGGTSGSLGSGAVTLASGSTLEFNRSDSYSASNNINGPSATLTVTNGTITLSGTKSLSALNLAGGSSTISGTNTITTLAVTGGNSGVTGSTITTTNVSGGTITFSGTNNLTTLAASGGTTNATGATIATANASGSAAVNFTGSNTITTANVSGGTATFSGTNSLTTLNLSGGTAKGGSTTGFGSAATLVLTGTGTLDLNGANASFIGNVPTGNAATVITDSAAGTGTSTVTFGQTINTNITTAALITDGATRKVGLAFTNPNAGQSFSNANNTFSGGLTLLNSTGGTRLTIGSAVTTAGTPGSITSSNFGTGAITIGQAATDKAGIYVTNATTVANDIVFNTALGTDTPGIRVDVLGFTLSGNITANLSDALFSSRTPSNGSVSLSGKITGAQGLRLDNTYNNITVTLGNAAGTNDYQGATTISGTKGVIILGASNQIPNGASAGNFVNNGTLRLQGFSDTINGLSGSGTVTTTTAGTSILTLGDNNTTSSFSGTISESTGTVGIIKTGSGDQTFTNTSSYTGGTQIDAGKLILGHATNTLANTGAVNVNGGELALGTNSDTVGAVTLTSGSITGSGAGTLTGSSYAVHSGSISAKLGGSGITLTKSTAGTVTLSGTNSYSGGTQIDGGTLALGHATDTLSNTGAVNINGGELALGTNSDTVGAVTLTSGSITGSGAGMLTGTGSNFDVRSGTISAKLGGTVGLDKTTGGTVTISSDNSVGGYTGATTVSAGTLIVHGNISTSSLTTVNGTGILGGSGSVGDLTIAAGGTHNPGNSPGIMNTGDYTMAGTLNIEAVGNTPGVGGYDQVNTTGTVNLSGTLATSFTGGTYANGDLLFILLNDDVDAINGTFSGLAQNAFVINYGGFDWKISYTANGDSLGSPSFTGGNDVALMAVPEPNVAVLLGGLGTLALMRRRRTV